jgi:hypothetical protein
MFAEWLAEMRDSGVRGLLIYCADFPMIKEVGRMLGGRYCP